MTGYQSKKDMAQDKLTVDREQLEQWLQSLKDIDALHHSQEPESVDAQKAIADMGQALAQPAQQELLGGTREAFEIWAKSLPNYMDISRFEQGYSDCNTDHAWAGWQAEQPAQKPLPYGEWPKKPSPYVNDEYKGYSRTDLHDYAMQVLAAHGIKENT